MTLEIVTCAQRPELRNERDELQKSWAPFMSEDPVGWDHWSSLYSEWPEFTFFLLEDGDLVAEGNSIPVRVEGDELPDEGWRWALADGGRADGDPNAVSAIQVNVRLDRRGAGLSVLMLERMRLIAGRHGFQTLVAPVRPSLKSSYPLTPIDRYVTWRRDDGLLFDPWLRTHERLGAELVGVCHRSMEIAGSVAQWEEWTGLRLPETGRYVVTGALVPLDLDVETDRGVYVEPNVWMRHRV